MGDSLLMRTLIPIFQEVERSMKGIMSVPSYTVLLLLCLGGLSAQAATIYVRPQGNDATPCAQAQNAQTPRRTLNAGIACLSGGDTLIVSGGTYDEVIGTIGMGAPAGIPAGLSQQQPTVIQAAPGERVVLTPVTTTRRGDGAIIEIQADYIIIDGINIDGAWNKENRFGLTAGGNQNIFRNFELTRVISHGVGGTGDGNQIRNCHVHHNGVYDPDPQGSYQGYRGYHHGFYLSGSNHVIEGCVIEHQDDGYGIQSYTSNLTIRNSIISNSYNSGIIIIGGGQIYNNLIYNNGGGHLVCRRRGSGDQQFAV